MKIDILKILLISMTIVLVIPSAYAQFDDVYYDADQIEYGSEYYSDSQSNGYNDGVTYYDNDEYDYYYTSRIRRFYRPYVGFGFYDPCYVSYNYYDPYAYNYYGYPSASIYLGSGFGFGFSWNTWASCGPSYGGYGGYGGYYGGFGSCYNNYYACTPPACYVPPVCYPNVPGGSNGVYYGPRVTGNTGTSPRVPTTVSARQPASTAPTKGVAQAGDKPVGQTESGTLGRSSKPGTTKHSTPDVSPSSPPVQMGDAVASAGGQTPVDIEIQKDKPSSPKRPVFKPDVKYQPYPSPGRGQTNAVDKPSSDRPGYKPYTPPSRRSSEAATKDNQRPNAQAAPNTRSNNDRPRYTPPQRSNQKKGNTRSSDRNSGSKYSTPPRGNNRPSYSPPPRSNNKPSYSPSSRSGRKSNTSSNRSSSPSRSGSRSSGGSKSSTSPRGRG